MTSTGHDQDNTHCKILGSFLQSVFFNLRHERAFSVATFMRPVQKDMRDRGRPLNECGEQRRVLLIEDYEPLAEATAAFMESHGLRVRIASTGQEALDLTPAFQPEIVLCDVRLPDMSGFDVARALRATPGAKDVLIAIHTAMGESDLRALGPADKSVNMYLSKPLTEDKLDTLLSGLEVSQHASRQRSHPR